MSANYTEFPLQQNENQAHISSMVPEIKWSIRIPSSLVAYMYKSLCNKFNASFRRIHHTVVLRSVLSGKAAFWKKCITNKRNTLMDNTPNSP